MSTDLNGNGHVPTPASSPNPVFNAQVFEDLMQHSPRFKLLVENEAMTRAKLIGSLLDPRRDINKECGYPDTGNIDCYMLRDMYDREPVATRVVSVLPSETWRVQPEVYEDEDSEEATAFEQAWDSLAETLSMGSKYQDEGGSPVWEHLKRLDELSGIGSFGLLLIGIDDGLPLNMPVKGIEEFYSHPYDPDKEGSDAYPNGEFVGNVYKLVTNASAMSTYAAPVKEDDDKPVADDTGEVEEEKPVETKHKLLYLRSFDESLVQVTQYESNPTSPRHGQPTMYLVTFNDPRDGFHGGSGRDISTQNVHWTRVIHAADNCGNSEIFGVPRQRPVFNRLLDLRKLYGGSAEMYWQGAFPGVQFATHPQLGGDVQLPLDEMRNQVEQWRNGLQRHLAGIGGTWSMMSPTVVDPTPQILVHIGAICIQLACPVRIFMGSERGELASSQDERAWNTRIKERQHRYVTPRLIAPFVDRLIAMGVLPLPVGFSVNWPDLTTATDAELADVAAKRTAAMAQYVGGQVESLMDPMDYLVHELGYDEEEAEIILEHVQKHLEESHPDTDDAIMPGHVPAPPVEENPLVPVKVKDGEKLVSPEDGKPLSGKAKANAVSTKAGSAQKPNPFAKK